MRSMVTTSEASLAASWAMLAFSTSSTLALRCAFKASRNCVPLLAMLATLRASDSVTRAMLAMLANVGRLLASVTLAKALAAFANVAMPTLAVFQSEASGVMLTMLAMEERRRSVFIWIWFACRCGHVLRGCESGSAQSLIRGCTMRACVNVRCMAGCKSYRCRWRFRCRVMGLRCCWLVCVTGVINRKLVAGSAHTVLQPPRQGCRYLSTCGLADSVPYPWEYPWRTLPSSGLSGSACTVRQSGCICLGVYPGT